MVKRSPKEVIVTKKHKLFFRHKVLLLLLLIFFDGGELPIVTLRELGHHILGAFRKLSNPGGWRSSVARKGGHHGLGRKDGVVLDHATVLEDAAPALERKKKLEICSEQRVRSTWLGQKRDTHNDHVLADVDVGVDDRCVDH